MTRNITVERSVAAPPTSVWEVLADYPNISDWSPGVLNSYAIGDQLDGVGAKRQTELAPDGSMRMRETITEWVTGQRMVIAIDEIEQQPITSATMTFALADGDESTLLTMSYDDEADAELGPMLDEQFTGGFNWLIDALEQAAKARSAG